MIEEEKRITQDNKIIYFVKKFLKLLFFIVNIYIYIQSSFNKKEISHKTIDKPKIFNQTNNTFLIIRKYCRVCGLFSFYIYYLGCATQYINLGYIPIIDLKTHPNVYNGFTLYLFK